MKRRSMLMVVVVLGLACVANAALDDHWGDWEYLHSAGANTAHAWNGWSWQAGGPPTREAIVDYANVGTDNWGSGFTAPLVGPKTAGATVTAELIRVNRGWYDASAVKEFEVNGGSLTVQVTGYSGSGVCIIGEYGKGLAKVSAGTFTADEIWVGGAAQGTLTVTGGVVNVNWLKSGVWGSTGNVVNLEGGVINVAGRMMMFDGGATNATMNITNGALYLPGDWRYWIDVWNGQGLITAFGGAGTLVQQYTGTNGIDGQTIVTAIPEPATLVLLSLGLASMIYRKK